MSFVKCIKCGEEYDSFGRGPDETYCDNCLEGGKKEIENKKRESEKFERDQENLRNEILKVKLTTTNLYPNHDIEEVLGIITSECVFGMNVFRDFFAGMSDFFGGRSKASQKILRDARNTCLYELQSEAYEMGGDGIIAIDLDYSEISGKGKGMLFLVASGTVVKFKK